MASHPSGAARAFALDSDLRGVRRTPSPVKRRDNPGVNSMSDFDRNLATARTGYRTDQVTIDAGLRAYMIRVYNYMAAGVALTGLVAWFTFSAAVTDTGGRPAADVVRSPDLPEPADVGPGSGAARAGLRHQLRHQPAAARNGAHAVLRLCRAARPVAGVDLPDLYRIVGHPRVLHLGGDLRRAEPVGLHHASAIFPAWARSCSWA